MSTIIKIDTRTKPLLRFMNVLAWIGAIGFMVKAGAFVVSFGVTYFNPAASKKLYPGLDMSPLMHFNFWHYTGHMALKVTLLILQSCMLLRTIKILSGINLANPFTMTVAKHLERISAFSLGAGIIAIANNIQASWLKETHGILLNEMNPGDFLFSAGLIFIISQVFKRGIELQSESDLTV